MKILFELKQCYTHMDEDYQNIISIFDDGSIIVQQMKTYCYQPKSIFIDKPANNDFLNEVKNILSIHEKTISEIPCTEINPHWQMNIRVLDKQFSFNFLHRWCENNYDGTKNIRTQEDISKDFLIDLICAIREIVEKYYPKQIMWNRFNKEDWF